MQVTSVHNALMPAVYVCHMLREFREPAAVLHGSALDLATLSTPGRHITVAQNLTCLANAMRLAPTPGWYLPWGLRIGGFMHGPLTPAMLTAPTLGDGLDVFLRYFELRVPYLRVAAEVRAGRLDITFSPRLDVGALLPVLVEIPCLILQHYLHTVRAQEMCGARLEFAHAPVAARADYRRWFECEPRFGMAAHRLSLPFEWRAMPNLGHDDALWRASLRQCQELADSQGAAPDVLQQLRRHLVAVLDAPSPEIPTLESTARRLHLSPRTLIRRLRAAGSSYQQEVDTLRRPRAEALLGEQDRAVSEVAERLGFADSASFGRAFRRWTGMAPGAYRRRRAPAC